MTILSELPQLAMVDIAGQAINGTMPENITFRTLEVFRAMHNHIMVHHRMQPPVFLSFSICKFLRTIFSSSALLGGNLSENY